MQRPDLSPATTNLLVKVSMAVLFVSITAGVAHAQADFDEFVCFGDSLTDNGILAVINDKPSALYGADPMEALFLKGASPGDTLSRFATAGSPSSSLDNQIGFYEFLVGLGTQGEATLISLQSGANDLLDNVALLANNAPRASTAADAVIDTIANNLKDAFLRLRGSAAPGAEFIVWTLPDLSLTPRFFGTLTGTQIANLRGHIERVNRRIRRAESRARVAVLDLESLLAGIVSAPPTLRGVTLLPPPAFCDFHHLFADDIHPTAVSNALLANATADAAEMNFGGTIGRYLEDELADLAQIP